MHVDELADDRETEADAAVGSCRRTITLAKAFEDVREKLRPDADACVPHDDADVSIVAFDVHVDATAWRGELDRVRHQFQTICCTRPASARMRFPPGSVDVTSLSPWFLPPAAANP